MERLGAVGLALAMVTIALPAVAAPASAGVEADAWWTTVICSAHGDEEQCTANAHGQHRVTTPELAGNGELEVDGVTRDTCTIAANPFQDSCRTLSGERIDEGTCSTAVAITTAAITSGKKADDSEEVCPGEEDELDPGEIVPEPEPTCDPVGDEPEECVVTAQSTAESLLCPEIC